MHKLAIALSVGAAALLMNVEAKASDDTTSNQVARIAMAGTGASQATDMSSRRRYRYYGYRSYRPRHVPSYGYYQQPYYQPAPVVTFGFGGGGPRYGYGGHHRGW